MPGAAYPLGPFKGGLANVAERATIEDDQLAEVINMDFDIDGSLVARPPVVLEQEFPAGQTAGVAQPLGWYLRNDGVAFQVIAFTSTTWIYNYAAKTWTQIATFRAASFVQYDNKILMICETQSGGYWEGGNFTATTSMPLGSQITFYQERFWAFGVKGTANATTVWFSNLNIITPAQSIYDWVPNSNFFTVSRGDGQWITALVADTSGLLIFRNLSSYIFSYASGPANGTLRPFSKTIGAENQWSVVPYENYYFVLSGSNLYQLQGLRHYSINARRVKFDRTLADISLRMDTRLSVLNGRIMVWWFGTLYSYSVLTNTWATWQAAASRAAAFFTVPSSAGAGQGSVSLAFTGHADSVYAKVWRITDGPVAVGSLTEEIMCKISTKAYSLDESSKYKRIFQWFIEVLSSRGVQGVAHPIALLGVNVTWNDLSTRTWNEMSKNTWNNLLVSAVEYGDATDYPTSSPVRTVAKLRASARFLRMYFDVFLSWDGTTATGPVRIYSITPHLKVKSDVSRKVS